MSEQEQAHVPEPSLLPQLAPVLYVSDHLAIVADLRGQLAQLQQEQAQAERSLAEEKHAHRCTLESRDGLFKDLQASEQDRARLRAAVERCRALPRWNISGRYGGAIRPEASIVGDWIRTTDLLFALAPSALMGEPPPSEKEKV